MDPVSIVGLISSCLSIADGACATIKNVRSLVHSYAQANQRIELISSRINTIRMALSNIESWAREKASRATLVSPTGASLEQSISCCVIVITAINKHVSACQTMGVKQRIQYLLSEGVIDDFGRSLDSQISALQLLLSTIQL
jgi:hypothetical protein